MKDKNHLTVRQAVLAERNRCAGIAESYAKGALDRGMIAAAHIGNDIAVAIRGTEPPPANSKAEKVA